MIASESDWLRSRDPHELLAHVQDRLTPRQLRLFAVACCRRLWHLLPAAERGALEQAERAAEEASMDWVGLQAVWSGQVQRWQTAADHARAAVRYCTGADARGAAARSAHCTDRAVLFSSQPWQQADQEREQAVQSSLLRDIAGNPFESVVLEPHWRTPDVLLIAQAIYEQRDFAALTVLADALRDAGCEHSALHWHCEKPHHARGCWLLDLILSKDR